MQYGLLLFLVSSGLTLVFGIMGIINVAHGSFFMIGAYLAWSLSRHLGSLWLAIPLGLVIAVALGLALERIVISRLYERHHLYQVLVTFGLILVFDEARSLLWGDDVRGVKLPAPFDGSIELTANLSYPVYRLGISAVCLAVAGLMYWTIQRTRLGMVIRAGSSNREMVQSLGIDIKRIYRLIFALGVTLTAFAGMIASPVSAVFPGMGNEILIIGFVIVVIGGMGSVKGAMVASILIGLLDTVGKVLHVEVAGIKLLPELSSMLTYLLMAAVLLWRPEGLFGRRVT